VGEEEAVQKLLTELFHPGSHFFESFCALTGVICNANGFHTSLHHCDWRVSGRRGGYHGFFCYDGFVAFIHLGEEGLRGSIPTEVGMLSQLTTLRLNSNDITGSIPTEVGMLSQLIVLQLQENEISGTLPSEVCMLSKIALIELDDNRDNDDDDSPHGTMFREDINNWCESLP